MKNVLKIFMLIAVLFAAVTETADAQTRRNRTAAANYQNNQQNNEQNNQNQTAGEVLQEYFDFKEDNPNFNCVAAYLATNQASLDYNSPETFWGVYGMTIEGNSLEGSTGAVSSRNYTGNGSQTFDAKKAVKSKIVMTKQGDDVEIKLFIGNAVYLVDILGVVSAANGDVFYGTYGNKRMATISLIRTPCPQ